MRRLQVSILDLVTKGPTTALWGRLMQPNFASIMPQVVGVWCEEAGHDVRFVCYTGREDLTRELPADTDILFIAAYTQAAQLAYALSNFYRQRGVVTVLGGSHARCYPEDAAQYFDYVLGFTDKALVHEVLRDCAPHRPGLTSRPSGSPAHLPGVKERWKFIAPTLAKTPVIKLVPMIGSLGCPVHLQLLHRLGGRLPAARHRPDHARTSASSSGRWSGRGWAGTIPTSACASTRSCPSSRRRCPGTASTSRPRAAWPSCRSRT